MTRAAVVDIGTNTLLLLIAEARSSETGGVRVLVDDCRFARLGQGLDKTGSLAPLLSTPFFCKFYLQCRHRFAKSVKME